MKKNAFKSVVAALAVSAVAVSASAMTAFAGKATGDTYDTSTYDPSKATTKPTVSLSQLEISLEEAKSPVTIELSVKNAEGKYAPTGFHIDYDSRLTLVERDGDIAEKMAAGKKLNADMTPNGDHGLFVTTGASENSGRDGVLWAFDFQVPSDAKAGDIFPVEIMYKSTPNAKDLFTNVAQDDEGQLMQAWVFTNGIEQGYIKIEGGQSTTTTKATTTTTTTKATTTTTTTKATTTTTTTKATTTTTTGKATTTTTTGKATTTTTTTGKAKTTAAAGNSPKTGVAGAGVAVAGLAIAVGTAFALRKKED